jgi:lipopolysaccharide heptosyltransferase I
MADPRFLLVRMGSMGDVIHAIPAASALRDTFPGARIDWAIDPKWARLLEGNPDLTEVIAADRKSAGGVASTIRKMRAAKYTCAVDFQALYKSALLAFASGAPRRVGFQSSYAREGLASMLYTDCLNPRGAHKVEHNLTLAEFAGAKKSTPRFPLAIRAEDEERAARKLAAHSLDDFYVLNPGGGWLSKCWPAQRYGELHRALAGRYGWRGVVTFGPGEEGLARELVQAAGDPPPVAMLLGLGPVMALMRRARFVVSADTGPLHLAAALDVPVVGLFGPTDPARNGPYSLDPSRHIVLRNPQNCETTYRRGKTYSPAMLSLGVPQVAEAIARRWGKDS